MAPTAICSIPTDLCARRVESERKAYVDPWNSAGMITGTLIGFQDGQEGNVFLGAGAT